jgi:hypothetical protein
VSATSFQLAVLNPGGNDPTQFFHAGAGIPDDRVHPPTNYHAFAACTLGGFHREVSSIPDEHRHVLLLVRRDVRECLRALKKLKALGKVVALSLKESGLHQVAELLGKPRLIDLFREICTLADGALSTTPDLSSLYQGFGAKQVHFIPTPYPTDSPDWNFSQPAAERSGIFIGTREFDVPSRNHFLALVLARKLGEKITVFNSDGAAGKKMLSSLGVPSSSIINQRLSYPHYLRVMARHRIVFQLDHSSVPGQVAGDALLCRVPCVGGDGAIERIAFPDFCGHGRTAEEVAEIAARLLSDASSYEKIIPTLEFTAGVSFAGITPQLRAFFQGLG